MTSQQSSCVCMCVYVLSRHAHAICMLRQPCTCCMAPSSELTLLLGQKGKLLRLQRWTKYHLLSKVETWKIFKCPSPDLQEEQTIAREEDSGQKNYTEESFRFVEQPGTIQRIPGLPSNYRDHPGCLWTVLCTRTACEQRALGLLFVWVVPPVGMGFSVI